MNDKRRLQLAAVCSLLLHLFLVATWAAFYEGKTFGPLRNEPIVLTLQRPMPTPRQLVSPMQPSEEAPVRNDQIAEVNARAADEQLQPGALPGPRFDEEAATDTLASAPSTQQEPAPEAKPVAPSEPRKEEIRPEKNRRSIDTLDRILEPDTSEAKDTASESAPDAAKVQVAKAEASPAPTGPLAPSRGRLDNAVEDLGATNFDAIKDEIAPYLRQVRRKVELRWNQALLLNYKGTEPTEATVDCAIAPDGRLVSVAVAGSPADAIYAALCRNAIERAAPFGAFPFEVPEIYRGENLEIRWTFSFL